MVSDIAIIGGGFAGALAALVLARDGWSVIVVDPYDPFPPLFRADKLDGDQLDLLEKLGLREAVAAIATPVSRVVNIRGRSVLDWRRIEECGAAYQTMVSTLRELAPPTVERIVDRAVGIHTSADRQRVALAGGDVIQSRLAIVATGGANALRSMLGVTRRILRQAHSLSVGYTLAPPPNGFSFPSLAASSANFGAGVDYLSLFPIGDEMRANLFLYTDAVDSRIAAFRSRPLEATLELLPGVKPWIGECKSVGAVEIGVVDLSICENVEQAGVVLIGDAYRTSCPAVGTGLSCIMIDVIRLREHVGRWMTSPGMGAEKITAFYADPVKGGMDRRAHADALARRRAATDASMSTRLKSTARMVARAARSRLLSTLGQEPAPLRKSLSA